MSCVNQWILSFVNLSIQAKYIKPGLEKVSESLFQSVGLFNLFKITYTILPVEDIAPNHKVSKPRLEPQAWASKSEARPKPTASPHQGLAWLGLGQASLSGLRA